MDPARGTDTVAIGDLTQTVDRDAALKTWSGFAALAPAQASATPRPAVLVNADHPVWYQNGHMAVGDAPAVGCHFLHDVAIFDHGLRVHQGRLIADGSSLSPVSLDLWARRNRGTVTDELNQRSIVRVPYGLVVHDAGYWIHGHWLIDFLPRVAVGLQMLGASSDVVPLILPDDTPGWAFELLRHFFGLDERSMLIYDRAKQAVLCNRVCIPEYLYSGQHFFHPYFAQFYQGRRIAPKGPRRKFVLSRRNFESHTLGALKRFENRGYFERAAVARGYEVICPETLPVGAQVRLFSAASALIGEYGSGLHNAVFSPEGTVVGALRMLNAIQSRIGAAMGQVNVYGFPDREWRDEQSGDTYSMSPDAIDAFIDAADCALRDRAPHAPES